MPGWPSAAQRHELGAFPSQIGSEDVKPFFGLDPDDLRWVLAHRGDARLGAAVQLCSLRWLGFIPDSLAELPRPALLALCEQLESDPDDLVVYGARAQTRSDHFAAVRERAGFCAFDHQQRSPFEEWLALRAMEHERPKALWQLSCEHLRAARVVGPSVDVLVRMIGAARERAHAATRDALAPQLGGGRPRRLDELLDLCEPGGITWLEWLRTPAAGSSPAEILILREKLEHLRLLDAEALDLSMLPPGRVRILAGEARRRPSWEITRLSATRRHPLLLVFIQQMLVERGDELIDRYCTAIQNTERTAKRAVKDEREQTAREGDERSQLAGTLSRILLDALEHGGDPITRALSEVGEQRLRACVQDPGALAKSIDEQRRDATHAATRTWRSSPRWCSTRSICAPRAATSRCSKRSAIRTPTAISRGSRTRRCKCCRPCGDNGRSTRTGCRSAPGMSWRCGSGRVTRCARVVCTGPPATATAIRPGG